MYDVSKQVKRSQVEYGSERGSTDNIVTQAQAERMANEGGMSSKFYKEKAQELLGDRISSSL